MPRDLTIKKVLVIGSGPIVIGQAAEFDYAGTQACRALKSEGIEVVLVNSNPATIMTDRDMADRVYLEPISVDTLKKIIEKERPDSILPTLGGQTGLNLACELAESGYLAEAGVRLLGTTVDTIKKAEDRELFKNTMQTIGEPVIESIIVHDTDAAVSFADAVGYPLIVRPAYTLGGTGGGVAYDKKQLITITAGGLKASRAKQCLIEKSVAGFKEIEYEVMRDNRGNCVIICNMENLDPVGIHTGDSIVVAPTQTLRAEECAMLRRASINIISSLNIRGGCNVQFALDTRSMEYYLIEVNPRVSRSSALASKATGYPIARVAALVAIGYNLDEIENSITGVTYCCAEPALDYIVVKFPRWPFDKFTQADRKLGTRMKATGEVMSIGSNFEQAFLKALRSLEINQYSTENPHIKKLDDSQLLSAIKAQDDRRILLICEALRRGVTIDQLARLTDIDIWFLNKIDNIVKNEVRLSREGSAALTPEYLIKLKSYGFSDAAIATFCGITEDGAAKTRIGFGIIPAFCMVDTCAGEFAAASPYYYSTYGSQTEFVPAKRDSASKGTVVVLGSGPIRIGQGIEFDYCSVHCIRALKKLGYDAVMINNNPETVSTDSDISDRLYFEPLTREELRNILDAEKPVGVIVQFGGQTAIKLAKSVIELGYNIIGTDLKDIDAAEDREVFDGLLQSLNIMRPAGVTCYTTEQALAGAAALGYPVLVRPSYVLGGQGMEIAYNDKNISDFMEVINLNIQEHPILIDKYIMGRELEVDAVCDGTEVLIPGIMEHVERTGVHSGDSISVYPAVSITKDVERRIVEITHKLAVKLSTLGLINIQFILKNDELFIIEVNPRSSRTVPFISKVTGLPLVELSVRCALGEKLHDMGYKDRLYRKSGIFAVKVPVFSNEKIPSLEVSLSPEMKSTGEVLGLSRDYTEALLKGFLAVNLNVPEGSAIFMSISGGFKQEVLPIALGFSRMGFDIYATSGTAHVLNHNFIAASVVRRPVAGEDGLGEIGDLLKSGRIGLIINTPTRGRDPQRDGFKIRRLAVELGIPCFTSIDTASAMLSTLLLHKKESELPVISLQEI